MHANARICDHCQRAKALRRYCRACSPKAAAIYNREARREAKAAGQRYWLEWWEKTYGEAALTKRREYHQMYMRSYRRRRKKVKAA